VDTSLTAAARPPAARSRHQICQAARRGSCRPSCGALPGDECVFSTAPASVPATSGIPGASGPRLPRVPVRAGATARPDQRGGAAAVTAAAGPVTPAAVIDDTIQGGAMSGDRPVPGPFQTAAEARLVLRPADGPLVAAESRFGLLTGTLRAAGVELGQRDREVAQWLAGLDVQAIAPVIGWVSRAGRGPASGVIARALADAIAHRTALTSGCPDCALAAPEGCADHRQDAARAAEYEQALRSLATAREAQ